MASRKSQKRKTKRKTKLNARRNKQQTALRSDKAIYFYYESQWYREQDNHPKALQLLRKALKLSPTNKDFMVELVHLGHILSDPDVQLDGLSRLHNSGQLDDQYLPLFVDLLTQKKKYQPALEMTELLLERLPKMKVSDKRRMRTNAKYHLDFCRFQLEQPASRATIQKPAKPRTKNSKPKASPPTSAAPASPPKPPEPSLPPIPVNISIDRASFQQALSAGQATAYDQYEVALAAQRIRFRDSFENLICLPNLQNVQSLWYQEETARKVLKSFRGRALLSDEVGLGKTIEAGIILKEYIQRGMVKSALILTPTPLVSQWKEELKDQVRPRFSIHRRFYFRKKGHRFWEQPFILASINQAKSKRNFNTVTGREYGMVIVDEAHHLKNRNTLNWKLVNALKKRFLLLLTATPVENNLMELYNLITLLKPGQLKTATAFRDAFMTKGDPTSPQNRSSIERTAGPGDDPQHPRIGQNQYSTALCRNRTGGAHR
jgi:hypothetical protein